LAQNISGSGSGSSQQRPGRDANDNIPVAQAEQARVEDQQVLQEAAIAEGSKPEYRASPSMQSVLAGSGAFDDDDGQGA
jgi:hypothetical protein